jgi:hypothetical protein
MTTYNTNLAAEFHVLSILHRLGADASLTLGNKKAVDIFVIRETGDAVTIDVKGVAGPYDWQVDNVKLTAPVNHFLAMVCYEGKIDQPEFSPNVWVIPTSEIEPFIKQYKNRTVVSRAEVRRNGKQYMSAWDPVLRGS